MAGFENLTLDFYFTIVSQNFSTRLAMGTSNLIPLDAEL